METKSIKLNTLLISAAAVIAIELTAGSIIAGSTMPSALVLGFTRILQILVMVIIIIKLEMGLNAVGIKRATVTKGIQRGLLWSLCFGFISLVMMGLLMLFNINIFKLLQMSSPSGPNEIVFYFFVGVVLGPLAEEIFFRGVVFGYFRKFGFIPALIISTGLFIIPHMSGSALPITQLVGGLLFAVAYEVEKSLIVPIVIHGLGNLAIFSLALII